MCVCLYIYACMRVKTADIGKNELDKFKQYICTYKQLSLVF